MIEPPPTATLLGRIFAHRRGKRTVVSAPLLRVEPEGVPAEPANEPVADAIHEDAGSDTGGPGAAEAPADVDVAARREHAAHAYPAEASTSAPADDVPAPEVPRQFTPPLAPLPDVPPPLAPPEMPREAPATSVEAPPVVPWGLGRVEEAPPLESPVEPPAAEPVATEAVATEPVATEPVADPLAGTRNCAMCGTRVPVDADGLRCYLGHTLSPAHADRPRGGWLRRLLRRG